jgi:hypothetical protein
MQPTRSSSTSPSSIFPSSLSSPPRLLRLLRLLLPAGLQVSKCSRLNLRFRVCLFFCLLFFSFKTETNHSLKELQAGEATRHRSGLLAHGGGWARGAAVRCSQHLPRSFALHLNSELDPVWNGPHTSFKQLCTRSCSNKHTQFQQTHTQFQFQVLEFLKFARVKTVGLRC